MYALYVKIMSMPVYKSDAGITPICDVAVIVTRSLSSHGLSKLSSKVPCLVEEPEVAVIITTYFCTMGLIGDSSLL